MEGKMLNWVMPIHDSGEVSNIVMFVVFLMCRVNVTLYALLHHHPFDSKKLVCCLNVRPVSPLIVLFLGCGNQPRVEKNVGSLSHLFFPGSLCKSDYSEDSPECSLQCYHVTFLYHLVKGSRYKLQCLPDVKP